MWRAPVQGPCQAHGTPLQCAANHEKFLHYPTEEDWAQTGLVTVVDCRQMPCGGAWNGGECEEGLGVPAADIYGGLEALQRPCRGDGEEAALHMVL